MSDQTRKYGRSSGGKFARGNPGKPAGARHKTTRAVEGLLQGEAKKLTQKAVQMALAGDTTALRLCLARIAPPRKDTPVVFELPPMVTAYDAAEVASGVLQAVATGRLTPVEGKSVMALVEHFRRALELCDFERRLLALEAGQ